MSDTSTPEKQRRKRLSPVPENPETERADPSMLTPHQQALRRAAVEAFQAKKARRFLERHVKHISTNRDLADGIKFLFDEHGRPPANAPLEDIVDERRAIEYQMKWFEGILMELRNRLVRVREVEDYALEMLSEHTLMSDWAFMRIRPFQRSVKTLGTWIATRPARQLLLSCAAAAALSGCVMGPDYKRPDVPLPAAWRGEQPNAADVTNTAWWEGFRDPDLNVLISAALEANKDLRVATYRVEEFDARLQLAASAQYPQLNYSISGQRQQRSEEQPALVRPGAPAKINSFSAGLNLSWEADLWGRVKRANEAARADLLSTEEARRGVMLTVVSGVATSYVQLAALDQQLALARQTLKNRENALDLVDKKQRGGSATRLAVAQARSLVDELHAVIPQVERQIASVENALSVLLGRNPGTIARHSIDALALPPVPQGVPSDVLWRRPDVLAAEQALVAANARIGVAKAEYFPTVSLTSALGLASDDLRWLWAKTARTGEFTRTLAGPLFTGGRIEGDIREAEAVKKQMVERYLQSVQAALQEVEDALVYRSKAGEHTVAQERQVKSLEDVARLSRLRFEGGESTYLDVLDAERQVYAAQSSRAEGKRDQYLALIAIYKAMGGGWMVEQDKQRITATAAATHVPMQADKQEESQQ